MKPQREAWWRKADMTGGWRGALLRLVMLATIAVATAAAGVRAAEMPRVRSSSPFVRGVIDEAIDASPTFRTLVAAVGATDGIVYVETGVCGHGVRACLSLSVTQAGGFRFLRVLLDLRGASTPTGRLDLIGTIGHELCHVLEVLANRTLTTAGAVFLYYVREAATGNDAFETPAAISAGLKVRHEAANRVKSESHQSWRDQCAGPERLFGPGGWWAWLCL